MDNVQNAVNVVYLLQTMQKLEKLMDAKDDSDLPQLLPLSRGPNPYLDKERCLLCGCERNEAPELLIDDMGTVTCL